MFSNNSIDLSFIIDASTRDILYEYYAQAIAGHEGGSFLGTIVTCGGILEGMLTWVLTQPRYRSLAVGKFKEKWPNRNDAEKIENWDISRLIDVATALELLGKTAVDASWAVKDFRNFIHPYNLLRQKISARPDKSLAIGSLVALQEISRSLNGRLANVP